MVHVPGVDCRRDLRNAQNGRARGHRRRTDRRDAVHDAVLLGSYSLLVTVLAISLWREPEILNKFMDKQHVTNKRVLTDSRGQRYEYDQAGLQKRHIALTGAGAFLTGMVSVGIGEVTISQLARRGVPIAVAAATSVPVVIATIAMMTVAAKKVVVSL